MLDNVMFATESVTGFCAYDRLLTQQQYKNEVFKALYGREIMDNKRGHRIKVSRDTSLDTTGYISYQSYGNGTKSEYCVHAIPPHTGYYEQRVIANAYRVDRIDDNGHELYKFYAVLHDELEGYDEIRFCTYDFTGKRFI